MYWGVPTKPTKVLSSHFGGLRTKPFTDKKLLLLGRAPHLVFFRVKYQLNQILGRAHWLVPTGLSATGSGRCGHFE